MFGIEWSEFIVIGVVALIVIGPKELPAVLRAVGQWTTKIRRMAAEFQSQFQEAMREAEMADLKKEVDSLTSGFNPLNDPETAKWDPEAAARKNDDALKDDARKNAETDSALAVFADGAPAPTPAPDAAPVIPGGDAPPLGADPQPPGAGSHSLAAPPDPDSSVEPAALAAVPSAAQAQSPSAAAAPAPPASPVATGAAGAGDDGAHATGTGAEGAGTAGTGAPWADPSRSAADAAPVAEESSRA
jgi:sec-independent protein translocase protein TatB